MYWWGLEWIRSDLDVKIGQKGSPQVPFDMSSCPIWHVQQPFVQKPEIFILSEGISTCQDAQFDMSSDPLPAKHILRKRA